MKNFIKEKISADMVICIFLFALVILSNTSIGSDLGTSLTSTFDTWLSFIIKLFRYIAAAAIIGAVIGALSGRASWSIAVMIIFVAIIIANLEIVLDKLGLTKGITF